MRSINQATLAFPTRNNRRSAKTRLLPAACRLSPHPRHHARRPTVTFTWRLHNGYITVQSSPSSSPDIPWPEDIPSRPGFPPPTSALARSASAEKKFLAPSQIIRLIQVGRRKWKKNRHIHFLVSKDKNVRIRTRLPERDSCAIAKNCRDCDCYLHAHSLHSIFPQEHAGMLW